MKTFNAPILVTRPYLPTLESYKERLAEIWDNQWLTNIGPVLRRFQRRLADGMNLPETRLALFVNGTLALEIVYQALGLDTPGAEVITTPFTFVSLIALLALFVASENVLAHAVTLTSKLS